MAEIASHQLILISGAVASGKTTLAWRLAELARAKGTPSAAIDMDDLVVAVAGRDWSLVTAEHRRLACAVAGTIAARLFDRSVSYVAIAGSTLSPYEWEEVLREIDAALHVTRVLLRVSVDEAIRRAQGDDARGATRNPDVLARLHAAIDWTSVQDPDIELDTDGWSAGDVANIVWQRLEEA